MNTENVSLCGEEKLRPGEIDSRSIRLTIKNHRENADHYTNAGQQDGFRYVNMFL